MARFNMHSASSAILCDLLAQRLPVTYPEGAFVSGLFHDTGRMLIALALGEEHSKVVEMRKQGVFSPLECEDRVLGFTHPELSAEAMVFWKLPEQIQRAVRDHHQPAADPDAKAGEIPLSRVVDAANQLVNSEGLSIIENLPGEFADATIIEGLGLDAKVVTALLSEYKTEAGAMAQFFK
jgi:HD-like signal output (HDOD) protein